MLRGLLIMLQTLVWRLRLTIARLGHLPHAASGSRIHRIVHLLSSCEVHATSSGTDGKLLVVS